MDTLFGDATTAMPTPSMRAETGSLMAAGSPVPSVDLRRGLVGSDGTGFPPSNAIPGLDIDPPEVSIMNGKPQYTTEESNEGGGGWISRIVGRNRGDVGRAKNGQYKPLDQEEEP